MLNILAPHDVLYDEYTCIKSQDNLIRQILRRILSYCTNVTGPITQEIFPCLYINFTLDGF